MNIKPLLPGHVLVCPSRPHRRLTDLGPAEVTDLFATVQRVQRMLARHYFTPALASATTTTTTPTAASAASAATATAAANADPQAASLLPRGGECEPEAGSFNIALQDGSGAGQTVPHVHVHVIPRIPGASAHDAAAGPGDELYEQMAAEPGNVGGAQWDQEVGRLGQRPRPGGGFPRIEDYDRRARTVGEMEAEAEVFRRVLRELDEGGEEEEELR